MLPRRRRSVGLLFWDSNEAGGLGGGSGWYLSLERGIQRPPTAEMHGHLLWGELDRFPNFSTRELVSGQALATPGRGKEGG